MFSAHVSFDEKIPNRQTDYFREIGEMAVKFAPENKRLAEYEYLVNTYHVDDEDGLLYRVNRVVVRKRVIVPIGRWSRLGRWGWMISLQYTLQMWRG